MWHTFVKAGSGRAGVIVSLKQDKNEKPKPATLAVRALKLAISDSEVKLKLLKQLPRTS